MNLHRDISVAALGAVAPDQCPGGGQQLLYITLDNQQLRNSGLELQQVLPDVFRLTMIVGPGSALNDELRYQLERELSPGMLNDLENSISIEILKRRLLVALK